MNQCDTGNLQVAFVCTVSGQKVQLCSCHIWPILHNYCLKLLMLFTSHVLFIVVLDLDFSDIVMLPSISYATLLCLVQSVIFGESHRVISRGQLIVYFYQSLMQTDRDTQMKIQCQLFNFRILMKWHALNSLDCVAMWHLQAYVLILTSCFCT